MKTVVYESPFQTEVFCPSLGLGFVHGVEQPVTDEQAEALVTGPKAHPHFRIVDASTVAHWSDSAQTPAIESHDHEDVDQA